MASLRRRVVYGIATFMAVIVAARVAYELIQPMIVPLGVMVLLAGAAFFVLRRA
jgi:hypothetical protein